jgi:hypothetical protein
MYNMKISLLVIFSVLISFVSIEQEDINTIKGFAPKYIGQKVEIFAVEDYLSMKEKLIATAQVKDDSTFTVNFFNAETRKIVVKSMNNEGYMYIQPAATYNIYFPIKNKYDEFRPLGNNVEIAFQDLPESDINFKILAYDRWMNNFLGDYFYKKNLNKLEFVHKLDTFKLNVFKAYENDTNFFFKTFVRFSVASLDNIQYLGARNRFEKYDFYLKNFPVSYTNPSYMEYFNSYYKNIDGKIAMETNNKTYLGLLKSSPTIMINALGEEYTLSNVRIRELVLIKYLGDNYFTGEYPQTNILSVLDSLSAFSLFKEHKLIAKNLKSQLTEIHPGSKSPDFEIIAQNQQKTLNLLSFQKKHLYIQFIDFSIKESEKELELLIPLYEKYKTDVEFLTIVKDSPTSKTQEEILSKLKWPYTFVNRDDLLLKNFKIASYPSYTLIDAYGYIVESPALKPTPNGKYETIDKSFFYIKKINENEKKE